MQSESQRSDLLLSEVGGEDKLKVTVLTANFTRTVGVYKMWADLMLPCACTQNKPNQRCLHTKYSGQNNNFSSLLTSSWVISNILNLLYHKYLYRQVSLPWLAFFFSCQFSMSVCMQLHQSKYPVVTFAVTFPPLQIFMFNTLIIYLIP